MQSAIKHTIVNQWYGVTLPFAVRKVTKLACGSVVVRFKKPIPLKTFGAYIHPAHYTPAWGKASNKVHSATYTPKQGCLWGAHTQPPCSPYLTPLYLTQCATTYGRGHILNNPYAKTNS
jgi:hypothetical protein